MQQIKAIITSEEVLLRDPLNDNVVPIVADLQRGLKPANGNKEVDGDSKEMAVQNDVETGGEDDSPFEFWDLEISSRNLDHVRKLKSQITRLTARAQKVRDELEQLLDDDDDMADPYLSRKLAGSSPVSGSAATSWYPASPTIGSKISKPSRASIATVHGDDSDVEELEMLLEAYYMQIDGTVNKLTSLREYIDNTEDYINIQLDNHRNQLTQLELVLSATTVVIVTGAFCAILFMLIMSYARQKGLIGS